MIAGSLQLRLYRRARRAGATMHTACVESGVSLAEARLIDADDLRNPPQPEAFELPHAAPVEAQPKENDEMARARRAPQVEEVHAPDFKKAVKIYRNDIKPATSRAAEFNQEKSTAYKAIKKECFCQPDAARQAFGLNEMEESKRDDWLRTFNGILKELNIFMPVDMVDIAEGKGAAGTSVVPIGTRSRPQLATLDDSDLNPDDGAGEPNPGTSAEAAE